MTMRTPRRDPVRIILPMEEIRRDQEGSSEMTVREDIDMEADEDEEEEEHSAPANFVVIALPATDHAPSAEETEPFKTDESAATPPPHPAYRVTAMISIPAPVRTPVWSDAEVAKLLAISTPPSLPLSPWSSPLPQIPSPSLLQSPPSPVLSPTRKMAPKRATRSTPVTTTPAPTATTTTTVTNAQLQAMIDQGVSAALAARDATRNGTDSHSSGTGVRGSERVARECTYQDFMKCKPLYFKGTEGVVELTQWFERMETVFRISNCSVENQIKFSTCTLLAGALTWWNSHVMTVTHDVAYSMTWVDLRKKMTDKYCPRNEMKKLEAELWNLKVIGTDVVKYNQRFQELALLCVRMFPEESDKIERYVGGLPDMIHGNIVASKPKTMQEAIEMATELMDKRVSTIAERQAENKRKFENTSRNNQNQQQQQNKRQMGRPLLSGPVKRSHYEDLNPSSAKCTIVTPPNG
ncbi:reverse transcriptase domain-containing protein [Tanacetum coccineum]